MNPSQHAIDAMRQELARRELLTPVLVLLASHRPLAFAAGQLLYLLDPLAALAGRPHLSAWAATLSDPVALAELAQTWCNPSPASLEDQQDDDRV
jgi:hypothetical protein